MTTPIPTDQLKEVASAIRAAINASPHLAAMRDVGEIYHGVPNLTLLYLDGAIDLTEIARAAIEAMSPTATEEEGHTWRDNDRGGQDNLSAPR